MNDRGMKKWKPFNALINSKELTIYPQEKLPTLSEDSIEYFEEVLKNSMYTHFKVRITFIEDAMKKVIIDYVVSINPINKDIIFSSKIINFRQILDIQSI